MSIAHPATQRDMTTAPTSLPNRNAVDEAITAYLPAMREFIVRQLKQIRGSRVPELMLSAAYGARLARFQDGFNAGLKPEDIIEVSDCPAIVAKHWNERFKHACNGSTRLRNRLGIITEGRNATAHFKQEDMSIGDAIEYVNAMATVLEVIGEQRSYQQVVDILSSLLQTVKVTSSRDGLGENDRLDELHESRHAKGTPNGLKAWSDVVQPHPDILNGRMTDSTFAADLQQVADEEAPTAEYQFPVQFFTRSYITPGLRELLVNTVKRLTGKGGDPVVQLKTGFGGGKTHSLIALWHLVTSCEDLCHQAVTPTDPTGQALQVVFQQAGCTPDEPFDAKAAVLIGTYRSATESTVTEESGDPLDTLWGSMAYQLGGQSAYNIIGNASRNWVSPGGAEFDELFKQVGPCVILMDELVAYARNLTAERAGRFYTFLQTLTESVGRSSNASLVVTVPEGADDLGGDAGIAAAAKIEAILGRVETVSAPLQTHEAFEVVRRRLFQEINDTDAVDETCSAFHRTYVYNKREYPAEASTSSYLKRMKQCYPIHPEVFERLHHDWSNIHRFQRTRGVLRIMAIAIRRLHSQKPAPLIMPANLPFADPTFSSEFTKLLGDNWDPVLREIDGINSKPDMIDNDSSRFLRTGDGAAKRITRTVFLGSVPNMALQGLDDPQIRLGTVEPKHGTAVYTDALAKLDGTLYFMHHNAGRHMFRTDPNLLQMHQDIAGGLPNTEIDHHVFSLVNQAFQRRLGAVRVVVFPESSADVDDLSEVQLVVLNTDQTLSRLNPNANEALSIANECLLNRGDHSRLRKNMLVFVVAFAEDVQALRQHVRDHLAWAQIVDRAHDFNIGSQYEAIALKNRFATSKTAKASLMSAYATLLIPVQSDPKSSKLSMRYVTFDAESTGDIGQTAVQTLKSESELIDNLKPDLLGNFLERYFWRSDIESYAVDEIWDRFTELVYLPRLARKGVINATLAESPVHDAYVFAAGIEDGRFVHLGEVPSYVSQSSGFVVRRDIADRLLSRTRRHEPTEVEPGVRPTATLREVEQETPDQSNSGTRVTAKRVFEGSDAVSNDYNSLRDDIVKTLQLDGGDIKVTISIEATNNDGFSDLITNSVIVNSKQLNVQLEFSSLD